MNLNLRLMLPLAGVVMQLQGHQITTTGILCLQRIQKHEYIALLYSDVTTYSF